MENAYTLQLFDRANRDEFDRVFAALSPETDAAVQARRRWWCFDNPRGGVFALFHDGEQIAATCYLGGKTLSGAGPSAGYEIGETATDPRHQRRGLFSKLVRACVSHAASQERPLIYGTPNSQSTPGYAKLGFEIVESPRSWLFLAPRLRYALRRALRRPSSAARVGRAPRYEIAADDYLRSTRAYPRLNASDETYLAWRLADAPMRYRFARIEGRAGSFECAMRVGTLGRHGIVVASEYFLNGMRPGLRKAVPLLRKAAADLALTDGMAGIYLHGERPTGPSLALLYAARIVPHRILPICATGFPAGLSDREWFDHFQLSDCDIG